MGVIRLLSKRAFSAFSHCRIVWFIKFSSSTKLLSLSSDFGTSSPIVLGVWRVAGGFGEGGAVSSSFDVVSSSTTGVAGLSVACGVSCGGCGCVCGGGCIVGVGIGRDSLASGREATSSRLPLMGLARGCSGFVSTTGGTADCGGNVVAIRGGGALSLMMGTLRLLRLLLFTAAGTTATGYSADSVEGARISFALTSARLVRGTGTAVSCW